MSPTATDRPMLFVPIEIKAREFYGKLLFSLVAAERGYEVILAGQNHLINALQHYGRGVYLDKSVTVSKPDWFRRCRTLGHRVVAWDEEGLVYRSAAIYRQNRCCLEALELLDLFFAWGGEQAAVVREAAPDVADRIRPTGNPRFDLLRPEFRAFFGNTAETLRAEYGRFILVNTNFGFYNHFKGIETCRQMIERYPVRPDQAYIDGWLAFQGKGFAMFQALVPALRAAFPDRRIVVRPSPSENAERWVETVGGLDGVTVTAAGNAIEWILAADAIVHFNCTTGVEAFMLGVPAVATRPEPSDRYESTLPNTVSPGARTLEETVERVRDGLAAGHRADVGTGEAFRMETAERYITGIDGKLASERILDALETVEQPPRRRAVAERLRHLKNDAWPAVVRLLQSRRTAEARYEARKFPGLTRGELLLARDGFNRVSGRFAGVRIRRVAPSCFQLRTH